MTICSLRARHREKKPLKNIYSLVNFQPQGIVLNVDGGR